MDNFVAQFGLMFPKLAVHITAGLIVFARVLGFIRFAPVFNRKEINTIVKLSFAMLMTCEPLILDSQQEYKKRRAASSTDAARRFLFKQIRNVKQ